MPHNPYSDYQFVGPLLEDAHFTQHIHDYLMDKFENGITKYVAQNYGGGKYIIYLEEVLANSSLPVSLGCYPFEIVGPAKDPPPTKEPYFSPFTGKWE